MDTFWKGRFIWKSSELGGIEPRNSLDHHRGSKNSARSSNWSRWACTLKKYGNDKNIFYRFWSVLTYCNNYWKNKLVKIAPFFFIWTKICCAVSRFNLLQKNVSSECKIFKLFVHVSSHSIYFRSPRQQYIELEYLWTHFHITHLLFFKIYIMHTSYQSKIQLIWLDWQCNSQNTNLQMK